MSTLRKGILGTLTLSASYLVLATALGSFIGPHRIRLSQGDALVLALAAEALLTIPIAAGFAVGCFMSAARVRRIPLPNLLVAAVISALALVAAESVMYIVPSSHFVQAFLFFVLMGLPVLSAVLAEAGLRRCANWPVPGAVTEPNAEREAARPDSPR